MDNEDFLNHSASTTTTWDIPMIVRNASTGRLRVPRFQRSFVWDSTDVRKLFDSIYRGFPIGTLLLWKQSLPEGIVTFGPRSFEVQAQPDGFWVIDGQQRITSLVAALSPAEPNQDERFSVYFDLSKKRFVGSVRGSRPNRSIPVREVLESRRLLNWLRENGDDLESEDFDVADALGGALRDYRVPAYLVAEGDEAVLREVFDRVNSAGKPIKRAQVFHALFSGREGAGSPQSVADRVKDAGFGRIEESRIVQSLLAIRGGDVQRDLHEEFAPNEEMDSWYDRTEQALLRSIQFLRDEGMPHLLLLPLTLPIPVLAAFFHLHPDADPWNRKLLARWLWRGLVSGFGRESGQTPALRRAVRTINPVQGNPSAAPTAYGAVKQLLEALPSPVVRDVPTMPFVTKTANARFLLLALLTLQPLSPSGEPVNVAELFEDSGLQGIGQLVPGSKADAATRGFWAVTWPSLTGEEEPELLRSHAISDIAASALREGDFAKFLKVRRGDLEALTKNYLERKVEPDSKVRPPLASLIVGES